MQTKMLLLFLLSLPLISFGMEGQLSENNNEQLEKECCLALNALLYKRVKKCNADGVAELLNSGIISANIKSGIIPAQNSKLVLLATAKALDVMRGCYKKYNLDTVERYTKNAKKIIKSLAENGFDVNGRNPVGQTPLIMATIFGNIDLVKTLLKANADVKPKDHHGLKALHYAQENKDSFITRKSDMDLYMFVCRYPDYESNRRKIATLIKAKMKRKKKK